MKNLLDILSYRRPHRSTSLAQCARAHVLPLQPHVDGFGNMILDVGDSPHVLWSAHLDTVHREPGRQRIHATDTMIRTLPSRRGHLPNCLGADDGVGIWLLINMVRAGVPGRYIWHQGEENGGLGSRYIAEHTPHMLDGIGIAMAFDRRGTSDVITHQWTGRTASDTFAYSFAALLHDLGVKHYKPCEGIFTDTANYADILSECSNLSCGYFREHSADESIDVPHVLRLRDALCSLDARQIASLEVSRTPGDDGWHSPAIADGPWRDVPVNDDYIWIEDVLTNVTHACRSDYSHTGKMLCGSYVDTGDFWTVEDQWEPDHFCGSCLDLAEEFSEDWRRENGLLGGAK